MIKQHCIGSGRECDNSRIIFVWLIQILDVGWNEGFKGSLGFCCWHSVPPSRGEKFVTVVYEDIDCISCNLYS